MISSAQIIEKKEYQFSVKKSNAMGVIKLINKPDEIDQPASQAILIESFIGEYEKYLQPQDISGELTSWRDGELSVQLFYEKYFDVEFDKFSQGMFEYWVCAYLDNELVGWATFERERNEKDAVYMDLLIVSPKHQHKGIGEQLVKSLLNLEVIPELTAIHLLLRIKNQGGREFYAKLGFYDDQEYQRIDNFVDLSLLIPLTWKNPTLKS